MENLHLKNLKNIYSPKFIEDRLNNIETPHYVINNFKETFINDLYSNSSYHLIKIGMNIIEIMEDVIYLTDLIFKIKDWKMNTQITKEELKNIEQNHNIHKTDTSLEIHYTESLNSYKDEHSLMKLVIKIDQNNNIIDIYKIEI